MAFKKATKLESKARVVIMGPSGSGKTRTALEFAKVLAGPGGRVAVIDTEKGSAAKYSDKFDFDVDELTTFAPLTYVASIQEAERAGYAVIVVDSLTHAWTGKEGALEQVDKIGARQRSGGGNSFTAWKDVTPMHNALIDAMTGSSAHVIATMRSKMEYVIEEDARGKKVPRKVGMAPVQREGMEYEFDLAIEMDQDHRGVVTKSRCDELADAVMVKPGVEWATTFKTWLSGAPAQERTPLDLFRSALALVELPGDAVALYRQHRTTLAAGTKEAMGEAKAALRDRVAVLQKCDAAGATTWVVKKLQELDASPANEQRQPGDDDDQPDPTTPAGGASSSTRRNGTSKGSSVSPGPASGPVGLVEPWMLGGEEGVTGYLSQRGHWNSLENAVRKHDAAMPASLRPRWRLKAAWRLQTLSLAAVGEVLPLDGPHGCKALIAKWADEGPQRKTAPSLKAVA